MSRTRTGVVGDVPIRYAEGDCLRLNVSSGSIHTCVLGKVTNAQFTASERGFDLSPGCVSANGASVAHYNLNIVQWIDFFTWAITANLIGSLIAVGPLVGIIHLSLLFA